MDSGIEGILVSLFLLKHRNMTTIEGEIDNQASLKHQAAQSSLQFGYIFNQGVIDDGKVDIAIIMYDPIPEAIHLKPGNALVLALEIIVNIFRIF